MHNGEKLLFYSVYATIGKLSCALADLLDLKISEIPLSLSLSLSSNFQCCSKPLISDL